MQTIPLGTSSLNVSRLCYGCWRIIGWSPNEITPAMGESARRAIITAYESGYTFFDHANIYCWGMAEEVFGNVLKEVSGMRERVIIASKCGIRRKGDPTPAMPARWDFSASHIVASTEASLRRLGIETLDVLMLHRPDYLADPAEIARAFTQLKDAGKVRFFGISNFRPSLAAAVQAACHVPLVTHQVEISLAKLDALTDGTLDQCLAKKMTPMAWSPLAGGQLAEGAKRILPSQQNYLIPPIIEALDPIAKARGVSRSVIALAWLTKHPSKIIPVVGSTHPDRIREATKAVEIELTREEWYRLFVAASGTPLP
ncbi:MAG: aldo/keto reductase [Verrucomicrobiia bacterium]